MIFRRLDGKAKDARTIPPTDATSWRPVGRPFEPF